jgi:KUP system potassium uptake protein
MKLSYFPQFKVIHTSKIFHHQLYIPLANWLLMLGTIIVASVYKNTTALGNAYGVCVMFVTFFDTCMVSLAGMFVWRISPLIIILPFLTIASLDGAYLSSSLMKVPHGAWVTLVIATVLALVFLLWRYGKEQQWFAEAEDRFPTSHFVTRDPGSSDESGRIGTLLRLSERFGGGVLGTMKGLTVFFDKAGETTPIVFSQFLLKFTVLPEVIVFLHLRPLEVPSVPAEDRFTVSRLSIPNAYRLVVRYGYNDEIITAGLAGAVAAQIREYLGAQRTFPETVSAEEEGSQSSTLSRASHGATGTESALEQLDRAYAHNVVYIMGKEQMKIKPGTNVLRRCVLWIFLWIRENTRGKMSSLALPVNQVIEVGFLKEI